MNKILLSNIKEGTRFSQPLYLDDGENEFLPKGLEITENQLELLRNKGVDALFTTGKEIKPVPTESLEEDLANNEKFVQNQKSNEMLVLLSNLTNEDLELEENKKDVEEFEEEGGFNSLASLKKTKEYTEYLILVKNCQKIFDAVRERERLSESIVSKVYQGLIKLVKASPELCVALILEDDIIGYEMAKSAIDVASLSYLVANNLGLPSEKISDITIAALLHDVGMLRVNREILEKKEELNDAERQAVETHTVYGYNCLRNEFMYPETLAKIVLQHHEWYDGSGYPSRLSENEIDIGARILACIDAFTALTSKKPYRKAMLGYDAIKELLLDNGSHFDPNVINALIRSIGIFPIGSIVMLSDSSLCRVIKSVPKFPLRPQLRLLIDGNGTVYSDEENKTVNLQIQKNLFITQAIDPAIIEIK
ncbi:MAG: HD-GYP domain-containing protein [Treponemataceae bacterium]